MFIKKIRSFFLIFLLCISSFIETDYVVTSSADNKAECLYTVAGDTSALNSIETFLVKTETNEEASVLYSSLDNDPS